MYMYECIIIVIIISDYSLYRQYLSETLLEAGWNSFASDVQPYELSTDDNSGTTTHMVSCPPDDVCYGYFSTASTSSSSQVTLDFANDPVKNILMNIVSDHQVTPSLLFSQRNNEGKLKYSEIITCLITCI